MGKMAAHGEQLVGAFWTQHRRGPLAVLHTVHRPRVAHHKHLQPPRSVAKSDQEAAAMLRAQEKVYTMLVRVSVNWHHGAALQSALRTSVRQRARRRWRQGCMTRQHGDIGPARGICEQKPVNESCYRWR